jgi:hypothetical protein
MPHAEWACPSPELFAGAEDDNLLDPDSDPCPGALARSPVAVEASRAANWKGSIGALYPLGVPEIVVAAVECFEKAEDAWRAEGRRLADKRREG